MVYSVKAIPLFISIIIFNTTPFIASILGYLFLGDKVSKVEMKLMAGCFIGVVALAMAKGGFLHMGPPQPHHGRSAGPDHRFLRHGGMHGGGHGGEHNRGHHALPNVMLYGEDRPPIFEPTEHGGPPLMDGFPPPPPYGSEHGEPPMDGPPPFGPEHEELPMDGPEHDPLNHHGKPSYSNTRASDHTRPPSVK